MLEISQTPLEADSQKATTVRVCPDRGIVVE